MSLPDILLAASKLSNGFRTGEVDFDDASVRREACRMVREGKLFAAKCSHKNVRYFDTQKRADHCVRTTPMPKLRYTTPLRQQAGWGADEPMRITKDTIYTICPSPARALRTNTFEVY